MPATPSKYASNQFDSATRGSFALMSEVLLDARARVTLAADANPAFDGALTAVADAQDAWHAGETALANAEAAQNTPLQVDDLFDVNLLRDPALAAPEPPADTLWNYPARTLSTTAMPASATRLEAWRLGPGGAPERLAVGEADEPAVAIPSMYTFDAGETYDLWLTARNSKGTSAPGPVTVWTAP